MQLGSHLDLLFSLALIGAAIAMGRRRELPRVLLLLTACLPLTGRWARYLMATTLGLAGLLTAVSVHGLRVTPGTYFSMGRPAIPLSCCGRYEPPQGLSSFERERWFGVLKVHVFRIGNWAAWITRCQSEGGPC